MADCADVQKTEEKLIQTVNSKGNVNAKIIVETVTTKTTANELDKNNYHWVATDQPL